MARRPAARGKADANQAQITAAFRKAGVPFWNLSSVGGGCPDLCARARNGSYVFLEVKTATGKLRPSQAAIQDTWRVVIVRNVEEALKAVGIAA
jgi:hypothetical protein